MILDPIKRTRDAGAPAINRRKARRTNLKVSELIKVDLDGVGRVALRGILDALCLLLELGVACAVKQRVGEIERRVELLVLVGEVHGGGEGEGLVRAFELGDGEVGRKFEGALAGLLGERGDVGGAFYEGASLELDRHGEAVLGSRVDSLLSLGIVSNLICVPKRDTTYISKLRL